MTTQIGVNPSDPYITPDIIPDPMVPVVAGVIQTTLTTRRLPIVSGTTTINAETYNDAIPGPTFRLTVGNTVIVRLINNLPYPTGIHWHGIELGNSADGTEVTQNEVFAGDPPIQDLQGPVLVPAGGTYLYKFTVTRPGIFWYHPHHHNSTNRVFSGLYGMIVVTDAHEPSLADGTVLPLPTDTKQIVLSDITVCKTPGTNTDAYTLLGGAEWLSGAAATSQPAPKPVDLCELPGAVDDDGMAPVGFTGWGADDVPSLMMMTGRINEGQTVLTNGVNVGGRGGSPAAPVMLAGGYRLPVRRGQGLRLQIVNCATTRYFRLRLTDEAGQQVNLVRVGGEGGLIDRAVLEGLTTVPPLTFDPKYDTGEILLPPSVRADVVAAIPDNLAVGSVLTLWTRDFSRTGAGFADLPTVPVMHLEVNSDPLEAYSIVGGPKGVGGTPLRAKVGFTGPVVTDISTPATTGLLLNPASFAPPKPGDPLMFVPPGVVSDIRLTQATPNLGINGIEGHALHGIPPDPHYPNTLHVGSSRYAAAVGGTILELTVANTSGAHHPFHLHGFSMQPVSLTRAGNPTFTWDSLHEFRDSIDVPANYTLTFRVRLDNRPLVDGVTLGGWLGRWLFHCHIFFHHHRGMISEFVVTDNNGKERPYVDVGGSWAYVPLAGPTRKGTYSSPEGNLVTLAASYGLPGAAVLTPTAVPVTTLAPVGTTSGEWSWTYPGGLANDIYYVYITATDTVTSLQGQTVFRLQVGGIDGGSDTGDPHIATVDGKYYDFQSVGEFTLLRDVENQIEIQARQTPVPTATPVEDGYSGLTACVSINTAIAARMGGHRVSYQPHPESMQRLQFFIDGKPAELSAKGIDVGANRVTGYAVDGATAMRVDFANGTVLTVTPWFWGSNNVWLLQVEVSNPAANVGIMGSIPHGTWLPALPNGTTVGPRPADRHERFVALYQTFADAWRVSDGTSLFTYAPGTSTETFTDRDWPAEKLPCRVKPEFQIPGAQPRGANIALETAERICRLVTVKDLHRNCVFDVATTGDETLVKSYILAQDLRLKGTTVHIYGDKNRSRAGEMVVFAVNVSAMGKGRPTPSGSVTFLIDGVAVDPPIRLDNHGQASLNAKDLSVGEHKIRAVYEPGGPASGCLLWTWLICLLKWLGLAPEPGSGDFSACSSPNLLHTVEKDNEPPGDEEDTAENVDTAKITNIKIHPAMGIARVGNSPTDYFVGPEKPGVHTVPAGGYRDAQGRIKRQAARFRLFGYDAKGELVGEVTGKDAEITWTVSLANKKAEWIKFQGRKSITNQDLRRNPTVADRNSLIIDPGPRSLSGLNQAASFDSGKFLGNPVPLGDMQTDNSGRLLVLGGFGKSASPVNMLLSEFANNDGWYDDLSDGPVNASVKLKSGATLKAVGAWVICAAPKFAPPIENVITLYDMLQQVAVDKLGLTLPTKPSFTKDIYPLLQRAIKMKWVSGMAAHPMAHADEQEPGHSEHHHDELEGAAHGTLSDVIPPPSTADARAAIFEKLRHPALPGDQPAGESDMPMIHSDFYPTDSNQPLTQIQYDMMKNWRDGNFIDDWTGSPTPSQKITPDGLDRAALDSCVGGAFYPGIEAGWLLRDTYEYIEPFRLDPANLRAGDVTKQMALPWQADFTECVQEGELAWWPAQRPDEVFPEAGGPQAAWTRGLVASMMDMVQKWHRLGFIVQKGERYVETERDP
jgi:FtsP/CotA-like multicopper oxidase with cupredoxin domain